MVKPLLSTPVTVSGNVKIQCFTEIEPDSSEKDLYWGTVREARLVPLASSGRYGNVKCNLLTSDYSLDLPKYYAAWSDTFFSTGEKDVIDECPNAKEYASSNYNTDFCWGCKRVSWQKNLGNSHTFFAPFWTTREIPDEFRLELKLLDGAGRTVKTKTVKILLSEGSVPGSAVKHDNYLPVYLSRYASKLDEKVIRLDEPEQCSWVSGIDLRKGGVSTGKDTSVKKIWNYQQTVNQFDWTLANAFRNSGKTAKQIVPLAFTFDLGGLLNDIEKPLKDIRAGGSYWLDGVRLELHRFSSNYVDFNMKYVDIVTRYNRDRERNVSYLKYFSTSESIFGDGLEPGSFALREGVASQYARHLQKYVPYYFRWQLSGSSDERPYIVNMSDTYAVQKYIKEKPGYYYQNPVPINAPVSFRPADSLSYVSDSEFRRQIFKIFPPFEDETGEYPGDSSGRKQSEDYSRYFSCFSNQWFSKAFYRESGESEDNLSFENGTVSVSTGPTQKIQDNGLIMYKGILYNLADEVESSGAETFRVELDFKSPFGNLGASGPVFLMSAGPGPSSRTWGRNHWEQTFGLSWADIDPGLDGEVRARMSLEEGRYAVRLESAEDLKLLSGETSVDTAEADKVGVGLPYPFMYDVPRSGSTVYEKFGGRLRELNVEDENAELPGFRFLDDPDFGELLTDETKDFGEYLNAYGRVFIGNDVEYASVLSDNFFEAPYITDFGDDYIKYLEYGNGDEGVLWRYSSAPAEDGEAFLKLARPLDKSSFSVIQGDKYFYKRPGRKCRVSDIRMIRDDYENSTRLASTKVVFQLPVHTKKMQYISPKGRRSVRVYWRYDPELAYKFPELLQFALRLRNDSEKNVRASLAVFKAKYRDEYPELLSDLFEACLYAEAGDGTLRKASEVLDAVPGQNVSFSVEYCLFDVVRDIKQAWLGIRPEAGNDRLLFLTELGYSGNEDEYLVRQTHDEPLTDDSSETALFNPASGAYLPGNPYLEMWCTSENICRFIESVEKIYLEERRARFREWFRTANGQSVPYPDFETSEDELEIDFRIRDGLDLDIDIIKTPWKTLYGEYFSEYIKGSLCESLEFDGRGWFGNGTSNINNVKIRDNEGNEVKISRLSPYRTGRSFKADIRAEAEQMRAWKDECVSWADKILTFASQNGQVRYRSYKTSDSVSRLSKFRADVAEWYEWRAGALEEFILKCEETLYDEHIRDAGVEETLKKLMLKLEDVRKTRRFAPVNDVLDLSKAALRSGKVYAAGNLLPLPTRYDSDWNDRLVHGFRLRRDDRSLEYWLEFGAVPGDSGPEIQFRALLDIGLLKEYSVLYLPRYAATKEHWDAGMRDAEDFDIYK